MARDPHKLDAFLLADSLVVDLYRSTSAFPTAERYGLQSQLRRAAVSVAANIVEGCARRTEREWLQFVAIAMGSACEVQYLIQLAGRLGFVDAPAAESLAHGYGRVARALSALITALTSGQSPKSKVQSPDS